MLQPYQSLTEGLALAGFMSKDFGGWRGGQLRGDGRNAILFFLKTLEVNPYIPSTTAWKKETISQLLRLYPSTHSTCPLGLMGVGNIIFRRSPLSLGGPQGGNSSLVQERQQNQVVKSTGSTFIGSDLDLTPLINNGNTGKSRNFSLPQSAHL